MQPRLVVGAVLAVSVGLAAPSFAAPKPKPGLPPSVPVTAKDAAGDANGINDQYGLLPAGPPEQAGSPLNQASADILSVSVGRKDDGTKVTSLVGTMTLAAPPAQGTDYRIRLEAPGCSTFFLEYEYAPGLPPAGELRHNCDGGTTATFVPIDTTVTGSTITWKLSVKGMPGDLKLGSVVMVSGAQTSVETAAIIPTLDQLTIDKPYTIGK